MNALLKPMSGPITMTSLELVEFINGQRREDEAGLRHDHFMTKVPKVLGKDHAPKFREMVQVSIGSGATRQSPIYRLPKREACLMAMSYSYEMQAKVFDRMTELEARAKYIPTSLPEALRLAADLQEEKDRAVAALALAAPKAQALDQFEAGQDAVTVTQAAKLLGIKRAVLTNWMHANAWVYRQNGTWVSYDQHIKNGRLQYKEARYTDEKTGQVCFSAYCHILPKGLTALAKHFAQIGAREEIR